MPLSTNGYTVMVKVSSQMEYKNPMREIAAYRAEIDAMNLTRFPRWAAEFQLWANQAKKKSDQRYFTKKADIALANYTALASR